MAKSKKGHNKVRPKNKIRVRLFFVLILHIKFQVSSSSRSLVLQPTTLLYSLKRKSRLLNIDPEPYAKYQNPF